MDDLAKKAEAKKFHQPQTIIRMISGMALLKVSLT